jgi:penicillin amidase
MERNQNVDLKKIITAGIMCAIIIGVFSVPFGMIPALGNFLFPGNGLWLVPDEVPLSETIQSSQITNDVQVYRDQWGIPHIYGSSETDIIYALGYVHAQDRLFQMEMARRQSRGRLSEILGPEYLEMDKFNLAMLKEYWANKTLEEMKNSVDPKVQEVYQLLLKYCDGVNYFINTHRNALPLELRFLNIKPSPWTPLDSLVFEKYMAEMLTWEYYDFTATQLANILPSAEYDELIEVPLDYQIPICPNYGEFSDISAPYSELNAQPNGAQEQNSFITGLSKAFMESIKTIPQEQKRLAAKNNKVIGSNNWVVNGSKTQSGKPILCNDMHLEHALPGIWYEAHLIDTVHGLNGYGFFIAGVPVPIVGHNNYIAWGFTNTAFDVLDWYYYNQVDSDHYMYKGTPTKYGTINYSIPVKGQADYKFTVKTTVHGPVFTDFLSSDLLGDYSSYDIACQWVAQNVTWDFLALYGYTHSTNRTEFDAASEYFGCPAQNHIYADVSGHIGIRPTGIVPIRDDTTYPLPGWHRGNGTMLYNGSRGEGEWTSYLPFSSLPHSENPEQCYLASNNQMIAGPDFLNQYYTQHPLGIEDGYRARRINTLLASHTDITIEDMINFQLDVYSTIAGNMTPILVQYLNDKSGKSAKEIAALNALSSWDYVMDKTKGTPTLFEIWLEVFLDKTFSDDMEFYGVEYQPPFAFLEKLTREDQYSTWFNYRETSMDIETRNDTMDLALNTALNALELYFGTANIDEWIWGDIHIVAFPHITEIESLGSGPYPVNGTGFTLTPSWSSHWNGTHVVVEIADWGASERMIVDFSDMNQSISVIPSGERGVSTSKHYTDQLALYLNGKYHVQYFGADTLSEFRSEWIESRLKFVAGGA